MQHYGPILILIVIAAVFAGGNLLITHLVGPGRKHGPSRDMPYEAGMVPIGSTRERFNVRFYMVAMVFLVFDVEIVLLYPWALMFQHSPEQAVSLVAMLIFFLILTLALAYEWAKGVLDWK